MRSAFLNRTSRGADATGMRLRVLAVSGLLALAAPLMFASGPAADATAGPILYGLTDHWDNYVANDETEIGTGFRSGVVGTFANWGTAAPSAITAYAGRVRARGGVPMMDIYPPTSVTLGQIAAGYQDSKLVALANAFHTYGHPFLFRLFPEMNGNWESYSPGTHGQTAAQFVSAYRHVVTVFRNHGATSVKFVWNPNRLLSKQPYTYKQLYPGDYYVNWVGLDGYAWQDSLHGTYSGPWALFSSSIKEIRTFTTRPSMICETGVAPTTGKATWLRNNIAQMQSLGAKIGVYFNEIAGNDPNWRVDSNPSKSTQLTAVRNALNASSSVKWAMLSPTATRTAHNLPLSSVEHLVLTGGFS